MYNNAPQDPSRKIVPLVFITILVDMLGIGVLIPIIPQLFTNPTSPHYIAASVSYGDGYFLVGLLLALYSVGMFLAAPIFGELSDRYGRKKMLSYALVGGAFSYALFALGIVFQNIPLMLLSRLLGGLSAGNIGVAQAIISDITPPAKRAARFGIIGAAFGIGFILGPSIGGVLSDPHGLGAFGASTPFWFAAILASINVFWVLFVLPETNKRTAHPPKTFSLLRSFTNIAHALRPSSRRALYGVNFLFQSGFTFYTAFLGVLLVYRFDMSEVDIGTYFSYSGVFTVITQGFLTRLAATRFTEKQILSTSIPVVSFAILAVALAPTKLSLYFIAPFFAVALGLTMANLTAAISRRAGDGVQGEVLGINSSVSALAQAFPPLLGGALATVSAPVFPLFVGAMCIFLSAYVYGYVIHED